MGFREVSLTFQRSQSRPVTEPIHAEMAVTPEVIPLTTLLVYHPANHIFLKTSPTQAFGFRSRNQCPTLSAPTSQHGYV